MTKKDSEEEEEIKTIEKWKWSEMQGLELVTDEVVPTTTTVQSQQQVVVATEMETSVSNKDVSNEEKKTEKESVPSVGFSQLFRFADGLDYILMTIGTVGAIVHGCSLPIFLRFFADLVNSFGSNANNLDKMTQEVAKVL